MKAGTTSRELDYQWGPVTAISGIAGVVAYAFALAAEASDALSVTLSFIFAFGLTVSSIGLYYILGGVKRSPLVLIAAMANVIAATLLFAMIMVQLSIKAVVPEPDTGLIATWGGLDVAWDFYISTGTVLFGLSMFGRRGFGAWLGVPGLLIGGLLLIFNIATFPDPPANAGLVDLGPLLGFWYLVVCVRVAASSVLLQRQTRRENAAWEGSNIGVN